MNVEPAADELTALDEAVLRELTRSITTTSVVRLAADLWERGGPFGGDPVGLQSSIIEDLSSRAC